MLFVRLMRFLRGYICFTASEGFPERFLNLCNQAGVIIWETTWHRNIMAGKTDRRGFAAMHDCAGPAGVVLRAHCKRGLPFFLYEYRKRVGLLIGLVVCVATLAVLSGMVWTIEVQGNSLVPTEEILRVMEEQGLRLGVRRESLDARAISEAAHEQLPGVSWIALNLRGSSAVIELREELPLRPSGPDEPQNIVAAKSGQIRVFELYQGSAETGVGQGVARGSLLASGRIENADETFRYVAADAYVVARTNISGEALVVRRSTVNRVELRRTHYSLRFLSFSVPLGPRPRADGQLELHTGFTWLLGGRLMPLGLNRRSLLDLQPQERIKNDRQLQLAAAAAYFARLHREFRAAQVISQEVVIELTEEHCRIAMNGAAYENIGLAQPIG